MAPRTVGFHPYYFNPVRKEWVQQKEVVEGQLDPATLTVSVSDSQLRFDLLEDMTLDLDKDLTFRFVERVYSNDGDSLLWSVYVQVGGNFTLYVLHEN